MLARFVTTGHEPCTPSNILDAPITGNEQKIIFRKSIPGKQRNLKIEAIKPERFAAIGKRHLEAAGNAMSFRASDKLQLSDRIGENA